MSAGYPGRRFWIVREGVVVAAVRTKGATFGRSPIDRSDEEFDGWRHIDPKAESSTLDCNVAGLAHADNFVLLERDWLGKELTDIDLVFPDDTVARADGAFLRTLDYTGEVRGAVMFTAAFSFSGLVRVVGEVLLTSKMYALEFYDAAIGVGGDSDSGKFYPIFGPDKAAGSGGEIGSGTMINPIKTYEDWPPDEAIGAGGEVNSGTMVLPIVTYDDWPADQAAGSGGEIDSGTMINPIVVYADWPADAAVGDGGEINSGTMTTS